MDKSRTVTVEEKLFVGDNLSAHERGNPSGTQASMKARHKEPNFAFGAVYQTHSREQKCIFKAGLVNTHRK